MKKTILLFIVLISLNVSAQNNVPYKTETYLNKNKIKGTVKSIIYDNQIREFSKEGKLIEWKSIVEDGKIDFKNIYLYDENGKITEERSYNYDDNLSTSNDKKISNRKKIYKYDNLGNKIEYVEYIQYDDLSENHIVNREIYNYDNRGNRIKEYVYQTYNGIFKISVVRKYDDNGNQIEWKNYNDGYLKDQETFKYDDDSNLVEYTHYNAFDGVDPTYVFDYEGNETIYDKNEVTYLDSKHNYKYNNNGNILEINIFREDCEEYEFDSSEEDCNFRITMEYDKYGNEITNKEYNSAGKLVSKCTSEYEFDNKNNWIKKVVFINDKQEYKEQREIIYYK